MHDSNYEPLLIKVDIEGFEKIYLKKICSGWICLML